MVRSLYSGVAGMVSHQTKMDVVGNNISNVSTYGYKSSRATFKDVYYQTNSAAMAATPSSGGTNPKQVGYGAKVGSVDVNHSQSVMSTTGYTLDVAIAGEGYLQVMDADGNIFYTKAGMLDIDAEGNLVDINGYFVLGVSGSPSGVDPSSNRIKINLPYLQASTAKASDVVDNNEFFVESENQNENGNVNIQFTTTNNMPYGQKMSAAITSSSIIISVNANEYFETLQDFNDEMNLAIKAANGGIPHNAGSFTITMSGDKETNFATAFAANGKGLKGSEIVEPDFSVNSGSLPLTPEASKAGFVIKSVGDDFSGEDIGDEKDIELYYEKYDANGDPDGWEKASVADLDGSNATNADAIKVTKNLKFKIEGSSYEGVIPVSDLGKEGAIVRAGSLMMKNTAAGAKEGDTFVMKYPSLTSNVADVEEAMVKATVNTNDNPVTETKPSMNLGIGNGNFLLKGGTEGGEQTVADLTGISINSKGVLVAEHPVYGSMELGRIDLATFNNPAGLSQVGDTYFAVSRNSGEAILSSPGTNGTGDILGGTLETSNTDLAHEMADMITTQRGFQACSRMITVSDSMLEELINLKR